MIKNVLAIFLGGGFGAISRYLIGYFFIDSVKINLPLITLSINTVSCFIVGLLFALFIDKPEVNPAIKMGLIIGFCGGFSTYAAFSLEIMEMLKTTQILQAVCYISLTLVLGLLAVFTGVHCAKFL